MTGKEAQRCSSVLLLCGGVGGAKLAEGLAEILPPQILDIVVNTGDDLDWHGLRICPDLDTVMYALAGLQDPNQGWGVASDTWSALGMLGVHGAETWFQVGDKDLATHVLRTERLLQGQTLSLTTEALARQLGVEALIHPMTDDPVRTEIKTRNGWLSFQEYFVRERHKVEVHEIRFVGLETARPSDGLLSAIDRAAVIVFAPSNPIVSLGSILKLPGVSSRLMDSHAAKIGVSPLIAGKAVRGPVIEMLRSQGIDPTTTGIASLYADLLDAFLIDTVDQAEEAEIALLGVRPIPANILMQDSDGKRCLANRILQEAGWFSNDS